MAHEIPGFMDTRIAAVDLSGSQYCGVTLNGSSQLALPTLGARIVGILQNKPTLGQAGTIMQDGVSKAKAAAAIAAGALVSVTATGAFHTAVTGEAICGTAKTAAGAANEIFSVYLDPISSALV